MSGNVRPKVTLPSSNLGITVPAHVLPPSSFPPLKLREEATGSDGPLVGQRSAPFYDHLWRSHCTDPERSMAWCRSPSHLSREPLQRQVALSGRITLEGDKHHLLGTAWYSREHSHTYHSTENSELCKEGILISFPFAR